MGEYGNIKPQDLVKMAKKNCFYKLRQKGSHLIMTNGKEILPPMPMHPGKTLGAGLAMKILKAILKNK